MDHTLIYFLLGCVAWAALLFYIYVIRGAVVLGAGGKSTIVILGALLIPVLGISLWYQNESPERLKELGLARFMKDWVAALAWLLAPVPSPRGYIHWFTAEQFIRLLQALRESCRVTTDCGIIKQPGF